MEINYFIFVGLILRYLYYWSNNTYTMEYLKTKLYKSIIFSIAVSLTFFYISFSVHFPFTEWYQEAIVSIGLVAVGWAVDSVFLSLMKLYENKFNQKVNDNN